ncbi:hypothetical protein [Siphonobacter sp. SORGH_AS_0500]|uniref:hypothetical protein n=1 Tax=Siphonobacter sp. SORGH_AS_0500 TaxID=1864824 RepID=UPI00285E1E0F|nr:hypothetical protein [Siphonobacter sp. SORGH_AS_0500]MDR6193224.1 hypothetical protein [Siphonobacter sp. SORGH_AS_0500]
MPARKEYLSTPGQRALKLSAGIIGGYLLATAFHLLLAVVTSFREQVLLSSTFTFFPSWVGLMILAFLARNGWKIWGIYLMSSVVFSGIIYFAR